MALDVAMEDLLGHEDQADQGHAGPDGPQSPRRSRGLSDWVPSEGGPLAIPAGATIKGHHSSGGDESRFALNSQLPARSNGSDSMFLREGELMSKLHDLLHSAIGDGVARIVEELHTLLPRSRPVV
jgi:hypothetical protein